MGDGYWEFVLLACNAFRVPSLPAPLAGGVPDIETATTFLRTSILLDDSVHGGLLDKLI